MKTIRLFKPDISNQELTSIKKVFDKCWIGQGPEVVKFENEFKKFVKSKYAIAVNSGSAALQLAISAFNFKKGKNILVNNLTFVSSANAILLNNLKPILIDCKADTLGFDLDDAKKKINKNTVAIMIVHFGGHPAEMDKIMILAKEYNKPFYAYSAGTEPSEKVNKRVVNIMNKKGYDFLFVKPRKLTDELIIRADNVITMGCGIDSKSCPSIYGKKIIDWIARNPERGEIMSVSEKGIPKAQSEIEETTGIRLEASSSVVWMALQEKIKQKQISEESKTVLLFTGGLFDSRPNEPHF